MSVPDICMPVDTLRLADDADLSNWLEALEAHECTPSQFTEEILRREHEDPDVGWEALALLDQQYRRRKLSRDDYSSLKATLYQHFLHTGGDIRATEPEPVPVATPTPMTAAPATAIEDEPAPMVAVRAAPLVDIPVVKTTIEAQPLAEPTMPAGPVEVPMHGEVRVGDILRDRYRVVEILRRNASGTLVEAINELKIDLPGIRKRVAIQVVNEELAREQEFMLRIGRLQNLSHPSMARLFDVDADHGALLLVTELLNGPSLQDLLSRTGGEPLHASVTQSALRAVAGALMYAHSQGVTHGNVNAMNVIITQAGDFRLQGFEMQDTRHPADVAADRMAFARLAYHVLSGQSPGAEAGHTGRLRAPRGLGAEQWRALRDTLKGKETRNRDVLTAFASEPPGATYKGWGISAFIATVLGIAGYLYANAPEPTSNAPAAVAIAPAVTAIPAATIAPPPAEIAAPAPSPVVAESTDPARPVIDMPVGPSVVETTMPVAKIWIRRRGSLDSAVTFKWWTENGSAEADRDFRRIEPREETIPAGASGVEVLVPLMPDPERREPRTFWVKIDEPGRGATLGSRTLIQVAIVPPGYPVQR